MELSHSDLRPREPTVRTWVGWQPSAPVPLDLHAKDTLSWLLPPMTKSSRVLELGRSCPTQNFSDRQSLLCTPHQPIPGFLGAAPQSEDPSKQLCFLFCLFAQGSDLHWGLKALHAYSSSLYSSQAFSPINLLCILILSWHLVGIRGLELKQSLLKIKA